MEVTNNKEVFSNNLADISNSTTANSNRDGLRVSLTYTCRCHSLHRRRQANLKTGHPRRPLEQTQCQSVKITTTLLRHHRRLHKHLLHGVHLWHSTLVSITHIWKRFTRAPTPTLLEYMCQLTEAGRSLM